MTTVINIYTLKPDQRDAVLANSLPGYRYIGRSSDPEIGKYGNRYSHRKSSFDDVIMVGTAQEAVDRYAAEKWAVPGFVGMVKRELKDMILVCYCKPAICHGDWLAEIANER